MLLRDHESRLDDVLSTATKPLNWRSNTMLGATSALAASLCWAAGADLYRSSMRSTSPTTLNLVRSTSATLVLFIFVELLRKLGYLLLLDINLTMYLIVASLVGWALGDMLYFIELKWIGAS